MGICSRGIAGAFKANVHKTAAIAAAAIAAIAAAAVAATVQVVVQWASSPVCSGEVQLKVLLPCGSSAYIHEAAIIAAAAAAAAANYPLAICSMNASCSRYCCRNCCWCIWLMAAHPQGVDQAALAGA
jgi:hypothetical protein